MTTALPVRATKHARVAKPPTTTKAILEARKRRDELLAILTLRGAPVDRAKMSVTSDAASPRRRMPKRLRSIWQVTTTSLGGKRIASRPGIFQSKTSTKRRRSDSSRRSTSSIASSSKLAR